MTTTEVQIQVEEIAQAMVILDTGDTAEMACIGERLQELAGIMTGNDQMQIAAIALGAAAVISDSAGQGEIPAAVVTTVNQALETIQEFLDQPGSIDIAGKKDADEDESAEVSGKSEAESGTVRPEGLALSPLIDEAIVSEFLSRQSDSLSDMEKLILACESQSEDGALESLKRWFHTLKGESSLLGLTDVATICHATEDMIQAEHPSDCVDRLLTVKDWLQGCFDHLMNSGSLPATAHEILAQLAQQADGQHDQAADASSDAQAIGEVVEEVAEAVGVQQCDESADPGAIDLPDYWSKNVQDGDVSLLQDFIGEAIEHLDASEAHLLTIENDPRALDALNAVFRAFHTIKGLAGFVELDHIQALAHLAENLLDMARKGEIELRGLPMDLVFESVDMMKRLVEGVIEALGGSGYPQEVSVLPGLLGRLHAATSGAPVPQGVEPDTADPSDAMDPMPAGLQDMPATTSEDEVVPDLAVDTDSGLETGANAVDDAAKNDPPGSPVSKSGFVPLANMKNRRATGEAAVAAPSPPPQANSPKPDPIDVQDDETTSPEVLDAVSGNARNVAGNGKSQGGSSSVKVKEAMRVDAERLDHLIETIGEMVIAESMVSQNPEIRDNMSVKLARDLDHLDKISRELQEIGMSLRMVPVRPVFQKMARLVRDLAKKTGRKVEFVMAGEDTELDKNVVDKIGDPLVHMVRNAVDHGIESTAEERRAAGKPEVGRIELRAFHKGGNICIEIHDDGRGLPRDKILAKAIERGVVREGEVLSDREIHNLIFEAGFSTAQKVTDISGRGVGMDVVRRNIEELRGTCEISSEPGRGSTFSIKLPLTLAIIEGMVISCGPEHYIVPTLSVVRLVRPRPDDISQVFDRGEMLAFADEHLPLFRLGTLFNVPTAKTDPLGAVVVVVEEEGRKIGLLADDLLGQQSIVIKSLGEAMQNTEGVAGGAIMSNGNVALILDVAGLIRATHQMQQASYPMEETSLAETEARSG